MEIDDIYILAEELEASCRADGLDDLASQFDIAMNLGSSGMETLGAIRQILIANQERLSRFVENTRLSEAIRYVDRQFGRL